MTLKVENITKYYGTQLVLDSISFSLKKGEITGFLGTNGAGKTTMMNILTGYIQQWTGQVRIMDKDIRINPLEIHKNIGYLPEHNPLEEQLYVREYLSYIAGIYLPKKEQKKAVEQVIEKVDIGKEQHKKIGNLSKGYKQRIGLAQAIIHNPPILILDEPTTGLDPNQLELIRLLIKEEGKDKTILLSTHIMQEVEAMCNHILIINKGKLVSDSKTIQNQQYVKIEFLNPVSNLNLPFEATIQQLSPTSFLVKSDIKADIRPLIFSFAKTHDLPLITLQEITETPSSLFSKLTK